MSAPIYFLCLVLSLCLFTGSSQECDDGYEVFPSVPGSRYKMSAINLSWTNALTLCQSDGGGSRLIIVNSDAEGEVVKELASRSPYQVWVGINDIASEGRWVTLQGGLVTLSGYNKWLPGFPNGGVTSNCGATFTDALFVDLPCTDTISFICEKPNV